MPLRDKIDISSVSRGRRGDEENNRDGTRYAASSRSSSRSAIVTDVEAATKRTSSASCSHLSREAR